MLPITKAETNTLSLDAITTADGTSNTLMIGETLTAGFNGPRIAALPWIASGSHPTLWCIPDSMADEVWYDWSSRHSGMMVNFAMGDGSVRAIKPTGRDAKSPFGVYPHNPPTPMEQAFMAISGYADGDPAEADGVTN